MLDFHCDGAFLRPFRPLPSTPLPGIKLGLIRLDLGLPASERCGADR